MYTWAMLALSELEKITEGTSHSFWAFHMAGVIALL
jgi:hypothetical protein